MTTNSQLQDEIYFCNLDVDQRNTGGVLIHVKTTLQGIDIDVKYNFSKSVWCSVTLHRREKLLVGRIFLSASSI